MRYDVVTPALDEPAHAAHRRSAGRRVGGTVLKLLLGVAVFVATCAGWLVFQAERERHSPLPNGGGGEACGLWFVGSSSMHKWVTLQRDMLPWQTHNRGVDGANLDYLADRFASEPGAVPPKAIVFYGGENDIAKGASVEQALVQIERIVAEKRQLYGALPMFIVSVKPSPTRWRFRPAQTRLNRGLAALASQRGDLHFIDIVPLLLVNGRPGPFYQADGIHLSHVGYRRWGAAVRHAIETDLPHGLVHFCLTGHETATP